MTYREAADCLTSNNPLMNLVPDLIKRKKQATELAIKVLIEKAEELEKAETVNYKEI